MEVDRHDGRAGRLGELDDARMETVARPAWPVRGDADIVPLLQRTLHADERRHRPP